MGWEEIARAKRVSRDNAIPSEWQLRPGQVPEEQLNVFEVPAECGILTARELKITETDADVLVQKLLNREYSSHEVTLAFCKRAAIAQQLVNCLSEIFFDTALEAAQQLDKEYAATGVPRGPLHGLPVSLKDCFPIEGTDATIGYTAFANARTTEDEEAEITKIMRESGAILFCKTNVPTAMMSGETYNAIYGYTSNPYNRSLSSGGSSGGEGALLALRGSPLGVGTDVGGSVRIPASFCGLYSLKPSAGRFPTLGLRDGMEGQETVRNSVGPMANSLAAIELWSRAVLKSEPWMSADPHCLPIQYRDVEVPKKLCFGLLLDDGIVKPLPPVTRALLQSKAALEAAGHTVIEFHLDDPLYTDNLKYSLYRSAAADLVHKILTRTQEPWPRGMEMLEAMINGDDKGRATVSELWEAQTKRTEYARRVLKAWVGTKTRTGTDREIDALLMPCTPWPSCEKYGFTYDNYTSLWNVLDYCATTVPVTHVSLAKDVKPEYECRNEAEESVWKDYRPESLIGAPVAVQLVGRRLNEEYLLGVTRVCDDAVGASSF
ncbi:amidase signature domain-containing protein [Aspergillus pseudodeflectus]|uniref:amidase n=1 Tax=Aspergillus pseudodeflectus TaxID=176178 RepID=A0ABR4KXH3_9EURO